MPTAHGRWVSLELLRTKLAKAAEVAADGEDARTTAATLRGLVEMVDDLHGLLGRTNAEARATARGLNPVTLDTRGLRPALEELAGNLSKALQLT